MVGGMVCLVALLAGFDCLAWGGLLVHLLSLLRTWQSGVVDVLVGLCSLAGLPD